MTGKPNPRFVITERRERLLVLLSQGLNECEIALELKVGQSTISPGSQKTQQRITRI